MKILSIDAETNGLWGKAFAIGAVLYENGEEIKTFLSRCPINGNVDKWVSENVLPQLEDVKRLGCPIPFDRYICFSRNWDKRG